MASAAAIGAATDDSDEPADVAPSSSEGGDQNSIVGAIEDSTAEQLRPDGGDNEQDAVGQQEQRSERKRGRPRLIDESKDKLIQDVMLQRGTTNARMIQDELARKHSVKLAYEVIRRRVKELSLQSGGGGSTPVVGVEASSESDEDMEEDKVPSDAANVVATQQTGSETGVPGSAAAASNSEHQQIARDLDMLAETVRTIVSSVNDQDNGAESEQSDENEEQSISDSSGDDDVDMPTPDDASLTEDKSSVPTADETNGAEPEPNQLHDADSTVARGEHGEYSVEVCQLVVTKYADGKTHKQIASELNMPATSVQTIIKKAKRKGAVLPAQRAGRPRATSETLEKTIQDLVRAEPTMSARAVQAHLASINMLDVSFETIRRRVRDCRKKLHAGGGDAEQGDPSSDSDEGKEPAPPGLVPSSTVEPLQPMDVSPSSSGGGIAAALENKGDQQTPPAKRRKYGEYSTEVREACVQKHEVEGLTYATISSQLNIPHDTVRAIVRKAKKTGTVRTAPRSGRPRKTSDIVDKVIIQAVKANQRCTAKMIQEDLWAVFNVKVSCETVRRRVKANTKQRLLSSSPPPPEPEQASSSTLPQPISTAMSSFMSAQMPSSVFSFTPAAASGGFPPAQYPNNLAVLTPLPLPLPIYQPNSSSASAFGSHGALQSLLNSQAQHQQQMTPPPGNTNGPAAVPKKTTTTATTTNDSSTLAEESTETTKARKKRNDYSVEVREQCVSMHAQGQGYRRIGQELKMPHTTVRAIVEKVQRTGTVLPAARSGRPRKTDEIVDKVILQAVKNNEKCSARMIQEELHDAYGVKVSCETIRRRVKDHSRQRHTSNSGRGSNSSSELPISDVAESSQVHDFGFGILPTGQAAAPVPQHIPQTGPLRSFQAQLQGANQFSEYTTVL